ncbi:MAG TPA: YCF48-related protein [Bacteroidia bacterium]|nr:YCF48-related protein [Bacteroidia bacterium]
MKSKNTSLTVAGAIMLLLNPFMLNAQWSAVRFDQHNIFHNVSAPTSNTVFVTGIEPISSQYFIIRTNDAGAVWDSISFNTATDTFALTELYFFDASTGFVGGTKNGNQVLLKTTDNGNIWTDITPLPSPGSLSAVHFMDAQNGIAVGGAFLYTTFNGGTSWTMVYSFNVQDLFFADMNNRFACGDINGMAVVKHTADGGQSWNTILSDYDSNLFVSRFAKLDFINSNVGFTAMENSNKLYRTLDGGNSWQTIVVDSVMAIRDFDFVSADTGHVLADMGWMNEYRILLTVDGGQSWTMEYTTGWNFYGGGVVLNACAFIEQTGYTVASKGLVKKYFPSATGISEAELNGTVSVYPNPFSTSATLRIVDWSESGMKHAELKIYDALGREVFHSEIRTPTFELKRNNLPDGIYIYKVTNGNEILAKGKLAVTH